MIQIFIQWNNNTIADASKWTKEELYKTNFSQCICLWIIHKK